MMFLLILTVISAIHSRNIEDIVDTAGKDAGCK